MRLAKNLKPVTDPPDKPTSIRKLSHGFHQGSKPSDGSRAQIVAVSKPARENHAISAAQIAILMPKHHGLMPSKFDSMPTIAIRPGPRKDRDPKPHQTTKRRKVGRA
jgi:hypothetical protein